ncbi:hypothetical protein GCM10011613_35580 [Cellvibrio zantedeschiae]|uniref:Lipoprotein n=1 Tax=Cellvibrio zantedeschiae TaxID=1237077 RepID=A0ABQ3BB15_9GAMM|nr:hypothetical protein [Cellvibrio zantedeschiae]GGY87268.1 hypothetical protein GCM10011613_35580 [Cellvibrio zantedeschiae]
MKNKIWILLCCIFLSACGGEEAERDFNPAPSLVAFDIVDSYGVDTGYSLKALAIDPYINNGLFDVFWKVNSLKDYRVNIRVNSTPEISNSLIIYSDICGAYRACDQGGNVICEYTSDFYLSCNNARHPTDIAAFIKRVPQNVNLILEICDLDSPYCSYKYYPVSMQ